MFASNATFLKKSLEEISKDTEKITLKYYSNFSNREEEFEFTINDIEFLATTGNGASFADPSGARPRFC